jgi:flagellar motor switch protein FliG
MTRAERVQAELADDVEYALRKALEDIDDPMALGGVENTARILGRMPREANTNLLDQVRVREEDLAEDLARHMVSFEDLERLDARGIQALLRVVERNDLVLSLKGAEEGLRERFLSNLSTRAAADIREEIDILGVTRRSLVREAQERIVSAARKLAEEGVIYLDLGESDDG